MVDPIPLLQMAVRIFGYLIPLFMVAPWLSAWLMNRGFARAKVMGPPPQQCTQACFFASSASIVVIFGTVFALRTVKSAAANSDLLFVALYLGSQLLLVPLFLRSPNGRVILIADGAVVLSSAAVFVLLWLIFS